MPATGTPTMLASVFIEIVVDSTDPRSRYGNVSPIVALMFGKMSAAPTPEAMRAATTSSRVGATAAASVAAPMMSGPKTRKGLRPMRSEYGPASIATTMPGAPYAATTSPAVPVLVPNWSAICSRTGLMTRPL